MISVEKIFFTSSRAVGLTYVKAGLEPCGKGLILFISPAGAE
jgi:hypothetical protein